MSQQPGPGHVSPPEGTPTAPPPAHGYGGTPPYGPPPYGPPRVTAPPTNTLAVVALICSLLGVTLLPGLGSVVGIVAGHIALSQVKRSGEGGRGLAIAGLVVGYAGVVIIGVVLLMLAYAAAGLGLLVWMY